MARSLEHSRSRFLLFLLFCVVLAPVSIKAQEAEEAAVVRGFVRADDSGSPLRGANVVLRNSSGTIQTATAAGSEGYYQTDQIAPGSYTIQISFVGYQPYRDTIRLTPGERRTVSIHLTPSPQQIGEVTVEGRSPVEDAEAGLRRIDPASIERIPTPGPGSDLASYLRGLPGVTTLGDRGGRIYVRGGTPSQNLILVDGTPIYKPFHVIGLYSAFSNDVVSSTDFYAGGFDARYTSRISSVLDVQLRPGNTQEYQGSVGVGPFMAKAHVEGPVSQEGQSILVHARHSLIEEVAGPLFAQDVPYRFYDVTAKFHTQSESSQCSFMGVRTYDRGQIDPDRAASFRWDNTTVGGECLLFADASAQTLNVSFGTTHFNNSVRSADGTDRSSGTWKAHTRFRLSQPMPWGGTGIWGGRVQADRYAFDLQEPFLGYTGEDQFQLSAALHAGAKWTWNDRLTIRPSIGAQALFAWDGFSIDPRLRLSYQPGGSTTTTLTAAGGLYHQIPTALTDERDAGSTFQVWTPTPFTNRPLQSTHGLLGWDQSLGSSLRLSLEGWYKRLRNIPVPRWTPIVRFNTNLARADGSAFGADASLHYHRTPFRFSINYGYSQTIYRASSDNLGSWATESIVEFAPPHDLRHKVGTTMSLETQWVTANVQWQFGSGLPYTKVYGYDTMLEIRGLRDDPTSTVGIPRALYRKPFEARLPAYHRLDVSVQRTIDLTPFTQLSIEGGAINAYNRRNVFYVDIFTLDQVDQLPIVPYLSLEVSFH